MKSNTFTTLALASIVQALLSLAASRAPITDVKVTFYDWPDNSPPGPANVFDYRRGNSPDGDLIA